MPKIYTQEGLEEAYRNHIKDYMEENGLYDEIGLDSETAITVLKEKMDENGMLVFRWIDRNNFDANHDYFFFPCAGPEFPCVWPEPERNPPGAAPRFRPG